MKLKLFSILLIACCFINVMHGASPLESQSSNKKCIQGLKINITAIEKMFSIAPEPLPSFETEQKELEYLQKRHAMLNDLYKKKQAEDSEKGKQKKQLAAAIRQQKKEAADQMEKAKQAFSEKLQTGSAKTKEHIKILKRYIDGIEENFPKTKTIMPELKDESGLSDDEILANLQQRSQMLTKYQQEVEKMILFPIQGAISAKFSETEVKQFASIIETIIMMNALEKTITSENQKTNPNGLWIDNLKQELDVFTTRYLGILMEHPTFSTILQQTNTTLTDQDPQALQPIHHSKSPRLSFIPQRSHPYSRP